MKYISWIIGVLLAIVAVTFAVNNLGPMAVDLWPLGIVAMWPTYLVVLIAILVGFLYGATVMWFSGHGARREARRQRAEAKRLTRELDSLRKATGTQDTSFATAALPMPAASGD